VHEFLNISVHRISLKLFLRGAEALIVTKQPFSSTLFGRFLLIRRKQYSFPNTRVSFSGKKWLAVM
jgi:hypothetical protein